MGLRWGLFFKIILVLLFVALLAHELGSGDKLHTALSAFRAHWAGANALWALAALLLMPLNWGAETRKWLLLLRAFAPEASWRLALRGVLAGVTLAVFTPNRLGEFGGRALALPPELRWRAAAANVVSTLSQTLVVLSAGGAGLWWLAREVLRPQPFYSTAVATLTLLGVAALSAFYFRVGAVRRFVIRCSSSIVCHFFPPKALPHPSLLTPHSSPLSPRRQWRGLLRGAAVLGRFQQKTLWAVLGWAALRYAVYTAQYFFLLQFFGVKTGLWGGLAGISTLFLLQTGIPLPPAMGLVARGGLAVQVWSLFEANELSSLSATFALWILNLILPALVGTFFLLNVHTNTTHRYEKD
jgi:uncharacterized membrane protein YbhN (UPF0104 family)